MDRGRQFRKSIEVYKIREAVEPLAIFESVPGLTEADIGALDATVRELECVTTLEGYIELDLSFTCALIRGRVCRNCSRWSSGSGTVRSTSDGSS